MLQSLTAVVTGRDATFVLSSLMVAALSLLFQECMKPGMIFARYKTFLLYLWRKNWRRSDRWKRKAFMLQPLGMCIYCNSAWLAIAYYMWFNGLDLDLLLFMGMVFLWVRVFVKLGLK